MATDYRDSTHLDPNKKYSIGALLAAIRQKMFGKDVRESIAKGIEKVYSDAATSGNANMEVAKARGSYETLDDRLNRNDENYREVSTDLTKKVDKNGVSQVNWGMLDQSVKDQLASDKISVVDGTSITMENFVTPIQNDIGKYTMYEAEYTPGSWNADGTENLSEASTTKYYHGSFTVGAGQVYLYTAVWSAAMKPIIYLDKSNKVIGTAGEKVTDNAAHIDYEITVPTGAVKILYFGYIAKDYYPQFKKLEYDSIATKEYVQNITATSDVELFKLPLNLQSDITKQQEIIIEPTAGGWNSNGVESLSDYALKNYNHGQITITDDASYTLTGFWTVTLPIIICLDASEKVLEIFTSTNQRAFSFIPPKGTTSVKYTVYNNTVPHFYKNIYDSVASKTYVDNAVNSTVGVIIPNYYQAHMQTKVEEVKSLTEWVGADGDISTLIGDSHAYSDSYASIQLIKYLQQNVIMPKIFHLGDFIFSSNNDDNTTELAKSQFYTYFIKWKNAFGNNLITVKGNHDDNNSGVAQGHELLPESTVYNFIGRQNEAQWITDITNPKGMYGYFDNAAQKIRYVILNDCEQEIAKEPLAWNNALSPQQLKWIAETALRFDENGWSVIFISHEPKVAGLADGYADNEPVINMTVALRDGTAFTYQNSGTTSAGLDYNYDVNADFTAHTADIIGFFCGHIHKDAEIVKEGINFVSVYCDAAYSDDSRYPRVRGTETENAFDVMGINKKERKVKLIRIGAGENREFNY